MYFYGKRVMMSALPALLVGVTIGVGCAGVEARRDARWAAFEPLRPDPAYRLLPDRPHHLRDLTGKSTASKTDPVPVTAMLVEPPVIWKARALDEAGLEDGATRFHGQTIEVYFIARAPFHGELLAIGRNARMQEISRVKVPVDFAKEEAGFVSFPLPGEFSPGELAVVAIEFAE